LLFSLSADLATGLSFAALPFLDAAGCFPFFFCEAFDFTVAFFPLPFFGFSSTSSGSSSSSGSLFSLIRGGVGAFTADAFDLLVLLLAAGF